ncbi:hypothetical protein QQ045_012954 [Rhodiola kirilowii]
MYMKDTVLNLILKLLDVLTNGWLLSLASCKAFIVMDDELNILPISSHLRSITPVPLKEDFNGLSGPEMDLKNLKDKLSDDYPVGPLIKKCSTLDQGKAVITFLDSILDKILHSTIALTAARGRGKSAALGLSIAGAIAAGYSNIFVTAPSPENLKTMFEFVKTGFESLEYKEFIDYDMVESRRPEFKKAIIKVNVYRQHRQTVQYIQPHECEKLSQVELLVIDEAAAIPLPIVKSLLGPCLVFLSSTVNGYEGTGRSLSLKLIQELKEQSCGAAKSENSDRLFKEVELNESIRYAPGDPVESWLNCLLCLDVANSLPGIDIPPNLNECDLYYVNRDTLFSYHKDSELFLQDEMKAKSDGLLDLEALQQYAIVDNEADFDKALQNEGKLSASGLISVKSNKTEKHGNAMKVGRSEINITRDPDQIKRRRKTNSLLQMME